MMEAFFPLWSHTSSEKLRKLDWEALRAHVHAYPDALLRERAQHFRVHIHAIWYAMGCMNLIYKKTLKYGERSPQVRLSYLNKVKNMIKTRGKNRLVYVDESEFESGRERQKNLWRSAGKPPLSH
jgi:hypothetical protein